MILYFGNLQKENISFQNDISNNMKSRIYPTFLFLRHFVQIFYFLACIIVTTKRKRGEMKTSKKLLLSDIIRQKECDL